MQIKSLLWPLPSVFVLAVLLNYAWELAQAPLYDGMDSSIPAWLHCFVASLSDGLLVLVVFASGWVAFGRRDWFEKPGIQGYVLMLAVGLVIGVGIEWVAVHMTKTWQYTREMPTLPSLRIGIVPIVQMLILPPLVFRLVAFWYHRKRPRQRY